VFSNPQNKLDGVLDPCPPLTYPANENRCGGHVTTNHGVQLKCKAKKRGFTVRIWMSLRFVISLYGVRMVSNRSMMQDTAVCKNE